MLIALTTPAWPCAGLFHEAGALAESDGQEAIIEDLGGSVRTAYRVKYEGDAAAFGWVIPIFGEFESLVDGSDDEFDTLRELSQPQVVYEYWETGQGTSCGCTGASKGDGAGGGDWDTASNELGVDVVAEGFTGTYEYTVIEGTDTEAIVGWLEDRGWSAEMQEPTLQAYVDEGGVQFVAIALSAQSGDTPPEGRNLPPVDITTTGTALRFPSTMARLGVVEQLFTTIYVIGDAPAETESGWTSVQREEIGGHVEDDPIELYELELWELGGEQPVFLRVWADGHEGKEITRFDALVHQDAHTADAVFALDPDGYGTSTTIWLTDLDERRTSAWLLLPMLALGLGVSFRRHAKSGRHAKSD